MTAGPVPPPSPGTADQAGQVGGVLPDGRQAPAACEHSRHGRGQDREQAVAHAPPIPGSVMFLRTWVRGWRARADVVDDDISAGSQDEEMTRHHSSSPRGPRPLPATHHPIKAAQTPSPTDLADLLTRHPFQFYESTTGMSVRRNESRWGATLLFPGGTSRTILSPPGSGQTAGNLVGAPG